MRRSFGLLPRSDNAENCSGIRRGPGEDDVFRDYWVNASLQSIGGSRERALAIERPAKGAKHHREKSTDEARHREPATRFARRGDGISKATLKRAKRQRGCPQWAGELVDELQREAGSETAEVRSQAKVSTSSPPGTQGRRTLLALSLP